MSDRIVTGIRLLRAYWQAQRAVDALAPFRCDERHARAHAVLAEAKKALDAFETGAAEDFKLRQSAERE